jgi:hypothetical protein
MRSVAFAAQCAAILLVLGAQARAAEPEPEAEKGEAVKADAPKNDSAKREPDGPDYPPPAARWGVIGIGLATTAFAYGVATAVSHGFPDAPGAQDLRTPIIGPWMAIANNGCAPDDSGCSRVWIVMRTIATGIGGLAQAGGILVAIEGIFMPTQYASGAPLRAPKAPAEPTPSPDAPKPNDKNLFWMPTPMAVGTGGVGLGVIGRF